MSVQARLRMPPFPDWVVMVNQGQQGLVLPLELKDGRIHTLTFVIDEDRPQGPDELQYRLAKIE